jgi:TonB family protein
VIVESEIKKIDGMNTYLNYLLEANIGLSAFLILYFILLKQETDFRIKRAYMLTAIVVSIVFPLFHFSSSTQVPSLSQMIPPTWLPEVVVSAEGDAPIASGPAPSIWLLLNSIYTVGAMLFLVIFIVRLGSLLKKIRWSSTSRYDSFHVVESEENISSFSFFSFIFIGQANKLSRSDKQQIIRHESIHAKQFHSIDILLIHSLSILFWFNPLLGMYKKIFVQLHEFEADARAVENNDANDYCNLMARVALLSADIKLANHFSNSLTLKRIEMIRTIKTKITRWKLLAIMLAFPVFFFLVSCQDQIINEVTDIAKNSTMAVDYPAEVQAKLDEMKKLNPEHKFIVIEPNEKAMSQAEGLEEMLKGVDPNYISSINVMKNITDKHGIKRSFVLIDYNEQAKAIANQSQLDGEVFTIVEESATMPGGMEALGKFLQTNLKYPAEARQKNVQGNVMIQFVVNKDGSLSNFEVIRGVSQELDTEALRVAALLPNWNPGKQNGRFVRQRFVLPISFRIGDSAAAEVGTSQADKGPIPEVTVVGYQNPTVTPVEDKMKVRSEVSVSSNGKKIIKGTVVDNENNPLPGANILLYGGSIGTVSDVNGNFQLEVPEKSGQIIVSFVGYKGEKVSF